MTFNNHNDFPALSKTVKTVGNIPRLLRTLCRRTKLIHVRQYQLKIFLPTLDPRFSFSYSTACVDGLAAVRTERRIRVRVYIDVHTAQSSSRAPAHVIQPHTVNDP